MNQLLEFTQGQQNAILIVLALAAVMFFWGAKQLQNLFSDTPQKKFIGKRVTYPATGRKRKAQAVMAAPTTVEIATPKRKRRTKAEMLAASTTNPTTK